MNKTFLAPTTYNNKMTNKRVNRNYLIFAGFFVILSFFMLRGFTYGILWGVVIGISVWPAYEKFCDACLEHQYAFIRKVSDYYPLIFTLLFSVFFLIPICYGFIQLTSIYDLINQYISFNTSLGQLNPPTWLVQLPLHDKLLTLWKNYISNSKDLLDLFSHFNTENFFFIFSTVWSEVLDRLMTALVMIITLFFCLKHGKLVKQNYKTFFNYWFSEKSTNSIKNGINAVRGTINGVVLIGIVEGIILSLPLLMGGLNAGLIIGLVAGIAGVIPLILPAMILPFLGYLFFTGETLWAIIGAIDLFIVWFLFENVIKPQMIGKTVKINTFLILISMIGGMQILGPVGLFLGPSIVSMTISMVKDFMQIPFKEQTPNQE